MEFESWDDPRLAQETAFMSGWYRAKLGYRDLIRMIKQPPELIPIHTWEESKGKFQTRHCSREDHGRCPWCDKLVSQSTHKYSKQWAAVILHLTRGLKAQGMKPNYVGQLLAWRFGDDKKRQLLEVHEVSGRRIFQMDLSVTVMDGQDTEKMQKLIIMQSPQSLYDRLKPGEKARLEKMVNEKYTATRALFHPTPEQLGEQAQAESEAADFRFGGEFEPEIDEPKVGESRKAPAKGKLKGKPEEKNDKKTTPTDVPFDGDDPLADLDLPPDDATKDTPAEEPAF